jgi:hypothetical protein
MADLPISNFTALTGANVAVDDDYIPIVDASGLETKRITVKELIANTASFLQSGAGAVAGDTQEALRVIEINVWEFMSTTQRTALAAGDATVDMAGAINAAITASTSLAHNGSAGSGTRRIVRLPNGKYRLATGLTAFSSYLTLVADRAILIPDTGVSAITTTSYMVFMEGIVIIGGARAIRVASGNVDTAVMILNRVEFQDQTTSIIDFDATSASTLLIVDGFKIYNTSSSVVGFEMLSGTKTVIQNGWASFAGTFVRQAAQTVVYCDNVLGVPIGGSTVWFDNTGYVSAHRCRFGGESNATIIQNRGAISGTAFTGFSVTNCETFAPGKPLVEFFAIPNKVVWRDNIGQTATPVNVFKFDSAIAPTLADVRSYIAQWDVQMGLFDSEQYQGPTEAGALAMTIKGDVKHGARTLITADKVAQARANTGTGGVGQNFLQPSFTHTFGSPVRGWSGDTATYNSNIAETWNNQLTGLATGTYTAVYDVEIGSDMPVGVTFYGSDLDVVKNLKKGTHIVCVPFYFKSGTSTNRVGYGIANANNAQSVGVSNIRVFTGVVEIDTQNNILYGTAAPTTLQWEIGDKIINSAPAVRSPDFWFCTTAGAPGTWVANRKGGTFTCGAAATTTVNDTSVLATSEILLMPTNAAAATLMGAATSLYVSARTAATSFAVTTANAAAAAGTETFEYTIIN